MMGAVKAVAILGGLAIAGLGLGATGASAYAISGGPFTGTATGAHSFTVGGAYSITCPAASTTYAGTATGSASTSFTPYFGSGTPCTFFGLPASVSQSGSWAFTVTGGPTGGSYTGNLHFPAGTVTTISVPSAGCTVTITGTQQFSHGGANVLRANNVTPTGIALTMTLGGIAYTASGCPFSSGSDGGFTTGTGPVSIPGITVS